MQELKNKHVLVVGLGASGCSACRLLIASGAQVTAADAADTEALREQADELRGLGVEVCLGEKKSVEGQFDLVVASNLRRSWEGAAIVSGNAPVRMEPNFREIDFGRWEGLTAAEIEASDPVLYEDWGQGREGFDFPGGDPRADFRARVEKGIESLLDSGACGVLLAGRGRRS